MNIEDDISTRLGWFIKNRVEIAKTYKMDKVYIAPDDTFSEVKHESEDFIVYGVKDGKVKLLFGRPYVYHAPPKSFYEEHK